MPTSTWTVNVAKTDSAVVDINATHYDSDGNSDATFSSRIKRDSDPEISKFVQLCKDQLIFDNKNKDDSITLRSSVEQALNS